MAIRTFALAPIFVPQALWVAARASRLPEASGERTGKTGTGPERRLLVLGDSSAAGVGVKTQAEAVGSQIAAKLGGQFAVHWSVVARSGGTVRSTARLLKDVPSCTFDFVLIALGVNDAKNGVSSRRWTQGYRSLLDTINQRFVPQCICVSGLPPVRHFPILPWPLNSVLGDRAEQFDMLLQSIADDYDNTTHLPLDFTLDTSKMAEDGFHPGPNVYREWADRAAIVFSKHRQQTLP